MTDHCNNTMQSVILILFSNELCIVITPTAILSYCVTTRLFIETCCRLLSAPDPLKLKH